MINAFISHSESFSRHSIPIFIFTGSFLWNWIAAAAVTATTKADY